MASAFSTAAFQYTCKHLGHCMEPSFRFFSIFELQSLHVINNITLFGRLLVPARKQCAMLYIARLWLIIPQMGRKSTKNRKKILAKQLQCLKARIYQNGGSPVRTSVLERKKDAAETEWSRVLLTCLVITLKIRL